MSNKQNFEKLFSRDFSLPSVEVWVRGESTRSKGWTKEKQPFLPYIVTERSDDTVHFYYNLQGVEWVQDLLVKLAHEHSAFITTIEKTVLEKLTFIRPIYEKEKAIDLSSLKRFIKELEDGYSWFEAMWWFFQMDDESKIAEFDLENLAKVRTLTDKLCNSSDTVIRKSLAKIYPQLGNLSSVLTTKEIQSDDFPGKQELEKRYEGYFFTNNQLFVGTTKPQVAQKLGIHFTEERVKKVKQLKGNVACQGFIKGYVRRLMGHDQIHLLQEGEILVSPMTIPDFLPAMKKAVAFVTDEGGMLCHAAIVARELNKPCIVGTGIATQVLKDGDLVEVDANTGVVKILKRFH
ncbi:MAG: PEP-utilizing enzyme [Candidatus Levyibacteriota bacterium]